MQAYCSSDEDGEAIKKALLYLPSAPDIDEPEEGWGGDGPGVATTPGLPSDSGTGSGRAQRQYDVQLRDAPVGGKYLTISPQLVAMYLFLPLTIKKKHYNRRIRRWSVCQNVSCIILKHVFFIFLFNSSSNLTIAGGNSLLEICHRRDSVYCRTSSTGR